MEELVKKLKIAEKYNQNYSINEIIKILEQKDQRISELEQELNKANEKLKNIREEINMNFLDGQDYNNLKQKLAELKEKAIVPRFKIGQEVWAISVYRLNCVDSFIITEIGYCANYGLFYKTNMGINLYEYYYLIFATEQEAQAKLKEMNGNG